MSSDYNYLALRIVGPLQSWGFDSQYNRRNTALMPTKSAIAGMCCAALGYDRGSNNEREFLGSFSEVKMTAIAIPRSYGDKELVVGRLQDYHTVQNTRRASGSINNDCVLTHRQYLTDAAFGVLLEGDGVLLKMIAYGPDNASGLLNPVWGIWLGRKACIPATPVFAGLEEIKDKALRLLIGDAPIDMFVRQEEVNNFAEGGDSIPDDPVCFSETDRQFLPRRVKTIQRQVKTIP